jgi:hypothetical protein
VKSEQLHTTVGGEQDAHEKERVRTLGCLRAVDGNLAAHLNKRIKVKVKSRAKVLS